MDHFASFGAPTLSMSTSNCINTWCSSMIQRLISAAPSTCDHSEPLSGVVVEVVAGKESESILVEDQDELAAEEAILPPGREIN